MRANVSLVAGLTLIAAVALAIPIAGQTADRWLGTWKLDLAQSKFSGPAPRSQTLKIESVAGGGVKHTFDTVDAKGEQGRSERVFKVDGSDVPVVASGSSEAPAVKVTNAWRPIDDRSSEVISKRDGKVTTTSRLVLSGDGKTLTVTGSGTDGRGQPANSTRVFTKQ